MFKLINIRQGVFVVYVSGMDHDRKKVNLELKLLAWSKSFHTLSDSTITGRCNVFFHTCLNNQLCPKALWMEAYALLWCIHSFMGVGRIFSTGGPKVLRWSLFLVQQVICQQC